MDSIKKASSGHMGLPLGCAEIGAVLFGQEMYASPIQWNPTAPCSQELPHRASQSLTEPHRA